MCANPDVLKQMSKSLVQQVPSAPVRLAELAPPGTPYWPSPATIGNANPTDARAARFCAYGALSRAGVRLTQAARRPSRLADQTAMSIMGRDNPYDAFEVIEIIDDGSARGRAIWSTRRSSRAWRRLIGAPHISRAVTPTRRRHWRSVLGPPPFMLVAGDANRSPVRPRPDRPHNRTPRPYVETADPALIPSNSRRAEGGTHLDRQGRPRRARYRGRHLGIGAGWRRRPDGGRRRRALREARSRVAAWRARSSPRPRTILADGKPKTLTFGVADETAWRVGLPCGGPDQGVPRASRQIKRPPIARAHRGPRQPPRPGGPDTAEQRPPRILRTR